MRALAIASWSPFADELTEKHWKSLSSTIHDLKSFKKLEANAKSFVCEDNTGVLVGMAFLVSSGNPTEIYQANWSYIRFLSVHPDCARNGIGKHLSTLCIEAARSSGEQVIALHTSEMMPKAIKLYESLGFEVLREIDRRLGKRYWLYKLDLCK